MAPAGSQSMANRVFFMTKVGHPAAHGCQVRNVAAVAGSSVQILAAHSLFKQSSRVGSCEARLSQIYGWQVRDKRLTAYTFLYY